MNGDVLCGQGPFEYEFDAQILDQVDLKVDHVDGQTELRNLSRAVGDRIIINGRSTKRDFNNSPQPTKIIPLLINGNVLVAKTPQERSTGQ